MATLEEILKLDSMSQVSEPKKSDAVSRVYDHKIISQSRRVTPDPDVALTRH